MKEQKMKEQKELTNYQDNIGDETTNSLKIALQSCDAVKSVCSIAEKAIEQSQENNREVQNAYNKVFEVCEEERKNADLSPEQRIKYAEIELNAAKDKDVSAARLQYHVRKIFGWVVKGGVCVLGIGVAGFLGKYAIDKKYR